MTYVPILSFEAVENIKVDICFLVIFIYLDIHTSFSFLKTPYGTYYLTISPLSHSPNRSSPKLSTCLFWMAPCCRLKQILELFNPASFWYWCEGAHRERSWKSEETEEERRNREVKGPRNNVWLLLPKVLVLVRMRGKRNPLTLLVGM
jgi:hypothetical protein